MSLATRLRIRTKATHEAYELLSTQSKPTMAAVIKAGETVQDRRLMVYKAADGITRWLSRASTAFEDKDGEIVSKAALKGAAERIMNSSIPITDQRKFRWWHVGTKANEEAIDFGDCDLAFVCGNTLFAGGYFHNPAYAALIKADDEISIGFLPLDNNSDKTYDSIDIIEVSVCPHGTARNLFTGVAIA
jgi:hypothetical protein